MLNAPEYVDERANRILMVALGAERETALELERIAAEVVAAGAAQDASAADHL